MKKFTLLLIVIFGLLSTTLQGQQEKQDQDQTQEPSQTSRPITPKNMFEVGINPGYFFYSGEVPSKAGFAGGIHFRKALDYLFSIRGDIMIGMTKGESADMVRTYESRWTSGTVFGVVSLNNFRWDENKTFKKTNIYAMLGAGANSFETDFEDGRAKGTIQRSTSPHITLGAGIAVRVNKTINVGIEHQASAIFGSRADLLDGFNRELSQTREKTQFRDITNFTSLVINFNVGSSAKRAEPLYWINPLDVVLQDIADLKKNQGVAIQDTDDDGVIDAIDQEPDTAPGAMVDTKGRTLDSDRDGIPDHKDKEPYYTPRPGERVNSQGIVENPVAVAGGGVTEDRVKELIDEYMRQNNVARTRVSGGQPGQPGQPGEPGVAYGAQIEAVAVTEWFLPMLHFGTDSYTVKYSDYGTLASIARMMKGNPDLRLVVQGHTDSTGPESLNNYLSYQRANAVIEHLVNIHGIGRGRFVLQWKGQNDALVPATSSYMNRRVEFRVAGPGDVEMDPPSGNRSGF